MKHLFTLIVAVTTLAAFSATSFAGNCSGCPASGDKEKGKDKDKTEEGTQS